MPGRIRVENEAVYGGQPQVIKAKLAGQTQSINPNGSYDFRVNNGLHSLNVDVEPKISGLDPGGRQINISDDFSNKTCKVRLDQGRWGFREVSQ
jgi:hypothetical protein